MAGETRTPDGCARCGVPDKNHGWRRHCGGYFKTPTPEQIENRRRVVAPVEIEGARP